MAVIPFDKLFFHTADFGSHSVAEHGLSRTRDDGFAKVFGIPDLDATSVAALAAKIQGALDGSTPNSHKSWPVQEGYLRGFLALGTNGIYARSTFKLRRGKREGTVVLSDGGHRALALCLLGESGLDLDLARLDTHGPESLKKEDGAAILATGSS